MAAHMIARDRDGVIETSCSRTLHRPGWVDWIYDDHHGDGYYRVADTMESGGNSPLCSQCRHIHPTWASVIDERRR